MSPENNLEPREFFQQEWSIERKKEEKDEEKEGEEQDEEKITSYETKSIILVWVYG